VDVAGFNGIDEDEVDYTMTMLTQQKVYAQHHWTDQALIDDGFRAYYPVKRISMARILPAKEAPMIIKTSRDTIIAQAGYWIAYVAGKTMKTSLDEYEPRPIEPHIFAKTYRLWDEPTWNPTPTESHLRRLGCQPYFKIAIVWAKELTMPTWVQGLESNKPALSPIGVWLCIGTEGEPWTVKPSWFHARYLSPAGKKSA
jgi:hypothetical protein